MRKKILSITFLSILLLVPTMVFAAEGDVAQVGAQTFATLEAALDVAMGSEDEVVLLDDATLSGTYQVTDKLTINLGGFDIAGDSPVFEVVGGELNVTGEGTIKETDPYYAPIFVRGSGVSTDTNYSVVNIKNGVTLQGWSGIIVKGPTDTSEMAYGVVINCDKATINSVYDATNVAGHGIYINGCVKNQENPVKINVTSTSITSKGTGIYAAGYGIWDFTDTTINADKIGLGIKSGTIVLNNVTVKAEGEFAEPEGNGSGITPTGAAIQIEEYKNYAGKINLTINGGSYTSKNNSALLEYTTSQNGITFVEEIAINGGEFTSAEGKDAVLVSESFKETITEGFITGGTFSTDVTEFKATGYIEKEDENGNVVVLKEHSVTIQENIKNGKVTANVSKATMGDIVELTVVANEGYQLKSLNVITAADSEVEVVEGKFVMPDLGVIVTAEFEEITEEEKDNTPKTGSINMPTYAWVALAGIALVGIVTTKKTSKHSK